MRTLYRDMLYQKRLELAEYIKGDINPSIRLVRATMVLKALTFNKRMMEANFDGCIKELLQVSIDAIKGILEEINPEDKDIKVMTYANLVEALTF